LQGRGVHRTDLRRGEVYPIDLDKPGRRVLIVSSDLVNAADRPTVIIVPLTNTKPVGVGVPMSVDANHLRSPRHGLTGFFRCDQINQVERTKFDRAPRLAKLLPSDMNLVDAAIRHALEISDSSV
jgi:mRNA-degrading endonuclease toxin of MazEF toxin-antitoxin module